MSADDDWEGEHGAVVAQRVAKAPASAFYLDDAFSDGEDVDPVGFEFSSAAIRADLVLNLAPSYDEREEEDLQVHDPGTPSAHTPPATDASVSTIDINAVPSPTHAPSESQSTSYYTVPSPPDSNSTRHSPPEPPSRQLSTMFDQISLSGQNSPRSPTPPQDVPPDVIEEQSPQRTSSPEKSPTPEMEEEDEITSPVHEYPIVHIDASEPQPATVLPVVAEDPSTSSPPPSDASHLSVIPNGGTPGKDGPSPKAVSTPSLPMPPPSPSTPPRPSSSHRTTRSLGPSALEKVISKTRPTFLPPKNREEDKRHLADWEHMMKRSHAAGTSMN